MYLSHLLIDVGNNPDRPRPGRNWLRNRYHVHQRLCMGFPSAKRRAEDSEFLAPYNPDDFAKDQVHVKRKQDTGFLYRIDPHPGGTVSILVLSALAPDWDYAFQNAVFLLAATPSKPQPFEFDLENGSQFRFRVEVNPIKRLREKSVHPDGEPVQDKWIGKRVPVPPDQLEDWLERHAKKGGFRLINIGSIQSGYVYFNKKMKKGGGQRLRSVRYDGILSVTDSENFLETLASGIGPAKAFGFGLLSIARAR